MIPLVPQLAASEFEALSFYWHLSYSSSLDLSRHLVVVSVGECGSRRVFEMVGRCAEISYVEEDGGRVDEYNLDV